MALALGFFCALTLSCGLRPALSLAFGLGQDARQLQRVGERRQAHVLAGAHGDLVDRQPQRREILPQQRERPARLDDEHPGPVDRHHHQQVVDQKRRLARTRRP